MESIENFTRDMHFENFVSDDKTTSAVIRKLEIIGEAAKHIPEEIKVQNPQVPWKEMVGMRDKLIHFYSGVDYHLVWATIKERIPKVKVLITKILNNSIS